MAGLAHSSRCRHPVVLPLPALKLLVLRSVRPPSTSTFFSPTSFIALVSRRQVLVRLISPFRSAFEYRLSLKLLALRLPLVASVGSPAKVRCVRPPPSEASRPCPRRRRHSTVHRNRPPWPATSSNSPLRSVFSACLSVRGRHPVASFVAPLHGGI